MYIYGFDALVNSDFYKFLQLVGRLFNNRKMLPSTIVCKLFEVFGQTYSLP